MSREQMDLDKLRVFYFAAQAKSFTNSALNLSPSAISRHISDLEFRLKTPLFQRLPPGLELTEQGEILLVHCEKIFHEIELARQQISDSSDEPQGLIRLACPTGWMATVVVRYLADFLKNNPKITMSVLSSDSPFDFVSGMVHVAFLPYVPDRANLIQRYLLTSELALYASSEYLEKYGIPQKPEDLDHHRLIGYAEGETSIIDINWHLSLGAPKGEIREPAFRVNQMYFAAEEGLGIATLSKENPLLRSGKLVQVLPEIEGPKVDGYLVYPEHLKESKRIRMLSDYFINVLKKERTFPNVE